MTELSEKSLIIFTSYGIEIIMHCF